LQITEKEIGIMKRRLALLTLTTLAAVAIIGVVSTAPSPALAEGATQISGDARFAEMGECPIPIDPDEPGAGANYALVMTGDLVGCLYTFVDETTQSSPSGTYRETGTETFVGSYMGEPVGEPGTFETTYRFEAKYEDVGPPPTGEIFGRCQHPIVEGSGTGGFEGVSGRLDFKDDVETGEFFYRGHLRF
jgi:hypothetical protein